MNIFETFITLPMVTKNNNGDDIKVMLRVNAQMINSYYDAIHIHDNGQEIGITYVGLIGVPELLGIPIGLNEFEDKIKQITLPIKEGEDDMWFKDIPIRYKDTAKSELYGKPFWVEEFCKVNCRHIIYYHPMKRIYKEEDGEIDVILFNAAGSYFYTLLSLEDFESILNAKE